MKYAEALNKAMMKAGHTQYSLAAASGVSQPTIGRILSGKSVEPERKTLAALEKIIGPLLAGDEKAGLISASIRRCPVVGTAQLGDNGHYCELEYPPGDGDGFITWQTSDENAYAIRCRGDSMKPRIKDGEFVIIEPNHEYIPGDEVLVRTQDGRVMVKVYLYAREGKIHLGSVNDTHPTIAVPKEEIEVIHYVAGLSKSTLWLP